jgi:hypothetical protein
MFKKSIPECGEDLHEDDVHEHVVEGCPELKKWIRQRPVFNLNSRRRTLG